MEILETFPRVFCFPKSRINENGGNVRGLGNNEKLRETFQWLRKKKFTIYMLKKFIVLKGPLRLGLLNGAIELFSAALQATKQVSLSCSITTLPSMF